MAEKVVFLDVDGVLVIAPTFRRMAPELVAQLARILRETGAMVVVSSAWRTGGVGIRSRFGSELAACGEDGALVRSRVIGRTKDLWSEDTAGNSIRGLEIKDWLERHPFFVRYVILDDDGELSPLTHRLVRTNVEHGLTKEKADQAILMLNGEAPRG